MMIISRIFTSIFLLTTAFAFAQTNPSELTPIDKVDYVCTYQLDYLRDSTDQQIRRSEEMILFIGETVSKFQSKKFYAFDTILMNRKTEDLAILTARIRGFSSNFKFSVFKNYPVGILTTTDRIFTDHYIYREPMDLLEWKIKTDTATFSGYFCQKATTHYAGRDYEAWFTSEIPISEGPYKFNGLPGLIVKIKDTRNHYSFELISFVKSKEQYPIIFREKNYIETNGKAFGKARRDYVENSVERMAQKGVRMNMDSETQKETVKSSRNNYIEIFN
jgi:GLPGLI family protein